MAHSNSQPLIQKRFQIPAIDSHLKPKALEYLISPIPKIFLFKKIPNNGSRPRDIFSQGLTRHPTNLKAQKQKAVRHFTPDRMDTLSRCRFLGTARKH